MVSNAANPIVDAIARDGILRASRSLRLAATEGSQNLIAREDMSIASLIGGLSLANAKLGAVHGYASVLGGALIMLVVLCIFSHAECFITSTP